MDSVLKSGCWEGIRHGSVRIIEAESKLLRGPLARIVALGRAGLSLGAREETCPFIDYFDVPSISSAVDATSLAAQADGVSLICADGSQWHVSSVSEDSLDLPHLTRLRRHVSHPFDLTPTMGQ